MFAYYIDDPLETTLDFLIISEDICKPAHKDVMYFSYF